MLLESGDPDADADSPDAASTARVAADGETIGELAMRGNQVYRKRKCYSSKGLDASWRASRREV